MIAHFRNIFSKLTHKGPTTLGLTFMALILCIGLGGHFKVSYPFQSERHQVDSAHLLGGTTQKLNQQTPLPKGHPLEIISALEVSEVEDEDESNHAHFNPFEDSGIGNTAPDCSFVNDGSEKARTSFVDASFQVSPISLYVLYHCWKSFIS